MLRVFIRLCVTCLIILLNRGILSSQPMFTGWPGTVSTYRGQSVTLAWKLNVDLSTSTNWQSMKVSYSRKSLYINYQSTGNEVYDDAYRDRSQGFITNSNQQLGITLHNVQSGDVGSRYKCAVLFTSGNMENNQTDILLLDQPHNVVISPSPSGDLEEHVTALELTCSADSTSVPADLRPPMLYTWTRNGLMIDPNNEPVRHQVTGTGHNKLTINRVSRDDKTYSCKAQEDGSTLYASTETTLNVKYAPGQAVAANPVKSRTEGQDDLVLTCNYPSALGNPPANQLIWSIDSTEHPTTDGKYTVQASNLKVPDHDGIWTCAAKSDFKSGPPDQVTVIVIAAPSVTKDLGQSYSIPITGDLSQISCSFQAKPTSTISWLYNSSPSLPAGVSQTSSTTIGPHYNTTTSSLHWTGQDQARRTAGGTYQCTSSNMAGSGTTTTTTLTALYEPYDVTLNESLYITVTEGDAVYIDCTSDCSPACIFTWMTPGGGTQSGRVLRLDSVSKTDHRVFTCEAAGATTTLSRDLNVTVNYSPSIQSLLSVSTEPTEGDTVTLTCTVDSRPVSNIQFLNVTGGGKQVMAPTSQTDNTAVYKFQPIDCLHTGQYKCQANNNLGTTAESAATVDITVKCPPELYFTVPATKQLGAAVDVPATFQVGLIAHPLTESDITWSFSLKNSTSTSSTLPEGVVMSLDGNVAKLSINSITTQHYGEYEININNGIGATLKERLSLTPAGAPNGVTGFHSNGTTAVSISLQWIAGFNNGARQTFYITYSNTQGGDHWTRVVPTEPDINQRDLVVYKLKHEVNILPNQEYSVQMVIANIYGNTTGPSGTYRTKVQPKLSNNPEVTFEGSKVTVAWSLENTDSVTDIVVSVCVADTSHCNTHTVDPALQQVTLELPDPEAENFDITITMYDSGDVVNTAQHTVVLPGPGTNIVAVVVGVIVGLLAAALIVVLVILWRKGIIPRKKQEQAERMINNNGSGGHVNSTMTEIDEIGPYGTSKNNTTSNAVKTTSSTAGNAPASSQAGPVNADVYSVVNKKPKSEAEAAGPSAPAEYLYSEVNKPPKAPKPGEAKPGVAKPGETKPGTSRPVSVFPPALTPSSPPTEEMYAKVNKDKKKPVEPQPPQKKKGVMGLFKKDKQQKQNPKRPSPEGQQYENVELANQSKKGPGTRNQKAEGKKTTSQEMPYANVVNTGEKDGVYSEVQIPHMAGGAAGDNVYANTGDNPGNLPFMKIGKDGVLYAELDIINKPPAGHKPNQPDKIHGEENRTEYASINVDKLKKKK